MSFELSPELQKIYDVAPIGLAFLSPDCRYLDINQRMTEICGLPVAEHIGRSVRETVPAVAEQVESIVETILRTGEPIIGIEVNGQRPDKLNIEHFWSTSWRPLKASDGTIVGIIVVAEEVTERKRAQAALAARDKSLQESESALRELNETLEQRVDEKTQERNQIWNVCQDLLVICDLEGRYLDVNPAWATTLGWSKSDLLGKTSEWLTDPDEREKVRVETQSLAAGRRTSRFELHFRGKDGSRRLLSWDALPHQGRIYAMARDVTEQRRAEDALQESRQKLARVTRQTTLGAMTASIAHEINQPLTAIVAHGNAGLRWLKQAEPDLDKIQKALQTIVNAGHRTAEIVSSIRAMFRKEHHEKVRISVNDLVREVLALTHGEFVKQQIILDNELHEGLPQVTGERVQLQQVLLNLTMNAVEAMSSVADRRRTLVLRSQAHANHVLITVADSGTGIDPNDIDRVFEPFFTTKPQGMGMGLSICRSIVEAHNGRLWASHGAPHGSIFHIQLPVNGSDD